MTYQLRHHNQLSGDWAGCISCDQYTSQAEVHQDALTCGVALPHRRSDDHLQPQVLTTHTNTLLH